MDSPFVLPGAEACKNDWSLIPEIWEKMNRNSIDRHSYVLAIGGGAFLDMVGFAASTAHRGVRLIRVPTTSLSQGDGGVGVKNGINYFGKKNWVGSFSVPFAVINDFAFLESLDDTSRRAGIIEAIKVALVRNKKFFVEIEKLSDRLFKLEQSALEYVIQRSAEEHVDHISTSGDPYELGSARPLDFGHWVAHKLEQISAFRIGHGEAVAVGLAVDLIYSKRVGIISKDDCDRILNLIRSTGFNIYDPELSRISWTFSNFTVLEEFREHLGSILTILLCLKLVERLVNDMDETEILASIDELSHTLPKFKDLSNFTQNTDPNK